MRNHTVITTFILLGLTEDPQLQVLVFVFLFLTYLLSITEVSSALPVGGHGHQHLALAHLLQGTRQAVEVPVVLLQSFPKVQDHTRGACFGGKVVQVPDGGKEKNPGLPRRSAPPRAGGLRGSWEDLPRAPGLWALDPDNPGSESQPLCLQAVWPQAIHCSSLSPSEDDYCHYIYPAF